MDADQPPLDAWSLLDEDEIDDLGSHDLRRYWRLCCSLLERVAPGDSVEELGHIRRLIDEFCEHDPMSCSLTKPDKKTNERADPAESGIDQPAQCAGGVIANVAGLLGVAAHRS